MATLAAFRRANGLSLVPMTERRWTVRLGPLTLTLPNTRWRRRAIDRHDLHHVVTGYPCGLRGECQVATWEAAAGMFPSAAAQLFCLPLVPLGLLIAPRRTAAAWRAGRASRSLYGVPDEALGDLGACRRLVAGRGGVC